MRASNRVQRIPTFEPLSGVKALKAAASSYLLVVKCGIKSHYTHGAITSFSKALEHSHEITYMSKNDGRAVFTFHFQQVMLQYYMAITDMVHLYWLSYKL